ncbi:putative glutamate decarboxylase [Phaeomoniella chlamydospora]|uniref:Putative glutamate decarboxylase n=1 Tax=Phaeomoniella chlamydospora TaxID=158046 RepID=A0A0G2FW41_PHACM|nr:putative glutamate decarboxylase [Phaeomoniella chlamydospora]
MSGQFAGGISTQGGSASNATALLIARNTLYPDTKTHGNQNHRFAIFTSAHSHYSIEKAAQMVGFGSNAVKLVPADSAGCMISSELARLVQKSLEDGETPLFINATAGTTVLGAFDPIVEISQISKRHQLWLHVDGSWGGSTIFSKSHNHKLVGSHVADSLAINPHKMLGVPVTCSFLLGPDLRVFKAANTLPAAYLFHDIDTVQNADQQPGMWDIADLTLQCGRRGDSLKLALSWIYYGASGFEAQIDNAFRIATYLASLVVEHQDLVLVSSYPPPCLQVCFYFALNGRLQSQEDNSRTTKRVVKGLVHRGFMIDYAPGHSGVMFRAVINTQTQESTAKGLIVAILEESRTQTS